MSKGRWLFVLLLAAGCHRSCGSPEASLDPCIAAMDPNAADKSGRQIATACAPLYERKSCRKAILAAWQDNVAPAERPHIMVDACRDAYCPALPDPKPVLCKGPTGNVPLAEYAAQWKELNRAILEHDLGKEKTNRLFAAREAAAKKADASVDAGPPARVALRGTTITLDDTRLTELPESDAGARIDQLEGLLSKRSADPRPSVIFEIADDVPMGTVMRLVETATYGGHRYIAFAHGSDPVRTLDQRFARSVVGHWATVEPREDVVKLVGYHGSEASPPVEAPAGAPFAKALGELAQKDKTEQIVLLPSCATRFGKLSPALDAALGQKAPVMLGKCQR